MDLPNGSFPGCILGLSIDIKNLNYGIVYGIIYGYSEDCRGASSSLMFSIMTLTPSCDG